MRFHFSTSIFGGASVLGPPQGRSRARAKGFPSVAGCAPSQKNRKRFVRHIAEGSNQETGLQGNFSIEGMIR